MRPKHGVSRSVRSKSVGDRFGDDDALPCLVLAADEDRCVTLCEAARAGGWTPISRGDVPSALAAYKRVLLSLVVVDLHDMHGTSRGGFRQLLEWFAARRAPLIVICGNEENLEEEIWARQLGPWLYLTGAISPSELSVHLREAHQKIGPNVLAELQA